MKGFTVAEARARFGDLLDEAEQGKPVVIERHGVRFLLQAEPAPGVANPAPFFEWIDPAVVSGDWTWDVGSKGARFKPRRRTRR